MKKSRLLGAVCAAALVSIATASHGAVISQISGLYIGGTVDDTYDVTFHTDKSFNNLWDDDDDGTFGGGSSVFPSAPTFWGDTNGGYDAAVAIIAHLDATGDTTVGTGTNFLVPYSTTSGDTLYSGIDFITSYDYNTDTYGGPAPALQQTLDYEIFATVPYVSFTPTAVPVPAAVWLFGSGLIGLVGMARRKKA